MGATVSHIILCVGGDSSHQLLLLCTVKWSPGVVSGIGEDGRDGMEPAVWGTLPKDLLCLV